MARLKVELLRDPHWWVKVINRSLLIWLLLLVAPVSFRIQELKQQAAMACPVGVAGPQSAPLCVLPQYWVTPPDWMAFAVFGLLGLQMVLAVREKRKRRAEKARRMATHG